jgi:hypothetical protein
MIRYPSTPATTARTIAITAPATWRGSAGGDSRIVGLGEGLWHSVIRFITGSRDRATGHAVEDRGGSGHPAHEVVSPGGSASPASANSTRKCLNSRAVTPQTT